MAPSVGYTAVDVCSSCRRKDAELSGRTCLGLTKLGTTIGYSFLTDQVWSTSRLLSIAHHLRGYFVNLYARTGVFRTPQDAQLPSLQM